MDPGGKPEWSARAKKDMRRIAATDRARIVSKVEQYARNPSSFANQVIALTGSEYWRLRVGRYRVIFKWDQTGDMTVMVVLRVRHRREAYV
jgi:mRNA interferase RelE/StbE